MTNSHSTLGRLSGTLGIFRSRTGRRVLAAAAGVGIMLVAATPAQAATYRRSFSESSIAGSTSGTITFTGKFNYTVDAYLYRDAGATVKLEVCYYHFQEGYWWHVDGCHSAVGGNAGTTKHVTNLGQSGNFADIGMVRTTMYANGVQVDSDEVYNPNVVTGT
jgi:hypothetical protein